MQEDLLQRNLPYFTSLAKDWNSETQRFDSLCAGQKCAGNTGAKSDGTVTSGIVNGHGAGVPVAFIGGDGFAKMQWGANSIPSSYTVCSVTRYSTGS